MKKLIKYLILAFALMGSTVGCSHKFMRGFAEGYAQGSQRRPVTYSTVGNQTYGSDGSHVQKVGNTYYGNNGRSCSVIGTQTYCN